MSIATMFEEFLGNLKVDSADQISSRYGEITKVLNQKFRDSESTTANTLQVGSYGRYTGIKGISDLDMLYIMPESEWINYKDGKQTQLLNGVRDAIKARYPKTDVRVDRLVVTVTYTNFHIEVQPVFEEFDAEGNTQFKYPDTYNGGSWKITKPRQEMQAIRELNVQKNKNLRSLCKMARAWKNQHGIEMGGLLIDTLAYNFLNSTTEYDDKSFYYFDWMCRDFFKFLAEQTDRDFYRAPGSNQNVKVKKKFQKKANDTYDLCLKAINSEQDSDVGKKWKKVFGRSFPMGDALQKSAALESNSWINTEEFIEDRFPIDVKFNIEMDCDVTQNGFREHTLAYMLLNKLPLRAHKKLRFFVTKTDIPQPYQLKWKVLNRGLEAERRDCIRGQIESDRGSNEKHESTDFIGEHIVECYAIRGGVVVARASIDVPIK
ncbi:MAG: nucleotidyltransferase [Burkholderiales bacterium]|nr:nucleotidyltransferase [Burkholderiales bacterium]